MLSATISWFSPLTVAILAFALAMACGRLPPTPEIMPGSAPVLVGAGDIADCHLLDGASRTARLLGSMAGVVFTTGDHAYASGSDAEFASCYTPTWGRYRQRTRPSPGNHDFRSRDAAPYFAYFGDNAGPSGLGYYSYALGTWQILSLNSNVAMNAGAAQHAWLTSELAKSPRCTLAYWHHPRFSSAVHGNDTRSADTWRALYDAHADVALNGHDHVYERFAPQTPSGEAAPNRGVRQFTVGTGGAGLYSFVTHQPNSERRLNRTYGVLKLTLRADAYDWEFIAADGSVADRGTASCVL